MYGNERLGSRRGIAENPRGGQNGPTYDAAIGPTSAIERVPLPSLLDAVTQEVVEIGDIVDLVGRDGRVVIDTAKCELLVFLNNVARAGVAIARLANRTHVAHKLLIFVAVGVAELIGRDEVAAFGKHAGHVRVALKASVLDQPKKFLHLLLVVDIFGKDVFIDGIAGRAVDAEPPAIAIGAGQGTEEIPAAVYGLTIATSVFELVAGPEDGPFGTGIEPFGIKQSALVVVTQQADARFLDDEVEALTRVGAVADDISQTEDFGCALVADIGQHCLERFQVAVNITDDCPFQFTAHFGKGESGAAGSPGDGIRCSTAFFSLAGGKPVV